jgi:dinuclear metal center YbgI/SA1388 family protein
MPHSLTDITNAIEAIAPLHLAAAWDKVGLLVVGDGRAITRALLTIDVTSAVLDEAKAVRADLIVGYHPLLFAPLNRLDGASWQCRVAMDAVRAGIAIYSPHTALDAAAGGVNDWLIQLLAPDKDAGRLCDIRAILPASTNEPLVGSGRIARLEIATTTEEIARKLELQLGCGRIERSKADTALAARVHTMCAVCAGSGSSLLEDAAALGATVFVTGEMSHHDVLRAHALGLEVLLAGHTNTERGYLPRLASALTARTPSTEFIVSKVDRDPLTR